MLWFKKKEKPTTLSDERKVRVPEGLWLKCDFCGEIIYKKEVERNLNVCPKCGYHFRISAETRLRLLVDEGGFVETDSSLEPHDFLEFKDIKKYKDRIKEAQKKIQTKDAIICGTGFINGEKAAIGIFQFEFMGGSMGSVVGEKVVRLVEKAVEDRIGLVIFSSSGGARMQEGILSLMQMAKTSAAVGRIRENSLPFISVLTDPTMGGVTASFAMLGDIIIAEPKALIGFAGPRVIEQTIRQKLPEGFQRSEYLLEHGMLDMIVERKNMKDILAKLLRMLAVS